jgi:hypothetical protein
MSTTPVVWRTQSQVNTADAAAGPGGTDVQFDGQIVALAGGGYVVVWEDRSGTHGAGSYVVGQLYGDQGNRVGGETRLDGVAGGATSPSIAALPGGGFAMAFVVAGNDNIWVRVIGDDLASERLDFVETTASPASNPSITAFPDGSYVVAYTIVDGAETDIVGRRGSPHGHLGSYFSIDNESDSAGHVELATLSNGNFVAVYQDEFNGDPLDTNIEMRLFTAAATPVGGQQTVTGGGDIGLAESEPDVAALRDGGFVVVWTDDSGNASGQRIRATLHDNDGNTVRSNVIVNTHDAGNQNEASVVALDDGGFLVTWEDDLAALVRAQRFDALGNMVGTEFIVHQGIAADSPDSAVLSDGRIAYAIGDHATGDRDVVTSIWDPRAPQGPNGVLWQHAEGSPALANNVLAVVATTSLVRGTGDFDADGDAEILWHHDGGQVVTWNIEDGVYVGNHIVGSAPNSWQIRGTGDFDGDGDDDIAWHHSGGQVVTWEMEDGTYVTNHNHASVPNAWRIVGTGDFDGDGDADMLWRHTDGQVVTWEMEDGEYVVNHNLGSVPTTWQTRGTGDFDGDGDADILWHHVSGLVVTWEMEDGAYVTNHNIASAGGGWRISGAGDLDSDGDADILWRHNDGTVVTWEMEDGAYVTNHNYGLIPVGWQIRAIGEFDLA